MATTTINVPTIARYRGLPITIIGTSEGVLAIAAYGTPQEVAIAALAVRRRAGKRVYALAREAGWTVDVEKAAASAAKRREARDARRRR